MSVTDPHSDCLWCLSSDHDVSTCDSCQHMNPKALKEREAKLFMAKSKEKHHKKKSSPRHRRHRDSRRRRESRRHSREARSRSPDRRRRTWEVSPTVTPHPSTPLPSPASPTSPGQASVIEVLEPQVFSPAQTPRPASGSPPSQAPQYPAFPTPGADSSAFLNAMYAIFQQMAPGGAPAGPLAFSLGDPAPLRPAPFMPFLPFGNVGSVPVSAPVAAPVASEGLAPGISIPSTSRFRPVTPVGPSVSTALQSAPKLPVAPDAASVASEDRRRSPTSAEVLSTPRIEQRLHSRRRALRVLEEQEYQRALEEGELEDSGDGLRGLESASGLDTSPEWDLSSPGEYTEEAASFHTVVRKAASFLDLPLPVVEAKQNLLTEVLHPASAAAEPLLPFNDALLDPVLEVWKKPASSPAAHRAVARRYRTAPTDPGFLSRHPTPESLVVQASCSSKSAPGSFPTVPGDRDSKKAGGAVEEDFFVLQSGIKSHQRNLYPGEAAATQIIQTGLDTTDSVARAMGTTVVERRQAWLRNSGFSADVQSTLLDLPFDGDKLFGAKADSALERFKESRATANVVGKGYTLPFREFPPLIPPRPSYCSQEHLLLLEQEVEVLLLKGAVELVPEQERGQGVYSRYFLIPKKDGRLRPILDLRILNWFLKQEKFKMLTLAQVLLALNMEDWMVSVDLQDAYFHIPILKSHRKYLRFVVGSQHYQFAVLPFGLTSAPRVFTKVMSVVAAELRRKGIAVFPYLDDWLIKAKSPELVLRHLQSTTQLLFDLGFSVNEPKSHLEPSQRLLFIGAVLDTTLGRAFPPPQRIQDIQDLVPMFRNGAVVPVLKVLRLLGLFASCILLVTHARWHMRALQWCLRRQWSQHRGDLEGTVKISRDAAVDLKWWIASNNLSQGKPFQQLPPVATVITDASTLGWGAHLGDLEIKGLWSPEEQMFHINLLELRAVRLALKAFLPSLRGQSVQVLTDNTTTMWYINKQGGVGSYLLCREALRLWSWAKDHRICLIANHLAGVLNGRACGQSQSPLLGRPRVVSPSRSSPFNLPEVGVSSGRSVRHSRERALSVVLQPSVSDAGSVGGRVSNDLVRPVALRVSSHTLDSSSIEEDSPRPGSSNLNSSGLAKEGVVLRPSPTLNVPAAPSPFQGRPPLTVAGAGSTPQPPESAPTCLEIERGNLSSFSLPPEVVDVILAARRHSTKSIYANRWTSYCLYDVRRRRVRDSDVLVDVQRLVRRFPSNAGAMGVFMR
ncbi:hypothetical protein NDU88_002456 [Pleurodeles waltl]|uniref:ribonuclease H n=1 Tax=Pleurodeles waltl TaxID=8319 RepID=A0AAV7WRQ9_PLEWA|nr:hypothetical protein NDU88_002456 [Pleurodeles waltl]